MYSDQGYHGGSYMTRTVPCGVPQGPGPLRITVPPLFGVSDREQDSVLTGSLLAAGFALLSASVLAVAVDVLAVS